MKRNRLFALVMSVIGISTMPIMSYAQTITTVAGCGIGDDSLANKAIINGPVAVTVDTAGNIYIGDESDFRIRRISTTGIITTIAGTGTPGHTGDGGPATAANIGGDIYGLATDRKGNTFFVESDYNCIRKINASGIITTIAGTGTAGYSGDGGPATDATLNNPIDVVVDTAGNVIFTDWLNNVVRKIAPSGIITTIVGDGGISGTGNGGPATASELGRPFRLALDNKGNLYVASVIFQCICKVDTGGIITLIGGTGAYSKGTDGDGGPATAATMTSPCGLAADTSGNLYFSDIGNYRVRKINMNTGIISNYAGTGTAGNKGDGIAALTAELGVLEAVACDAAGNLLICDADNNKLRKVDRASGMMSTVTGQNGLYGDGGNALNTIINAPDNIATDAAGNIYVTEQYDQRVCRIDAVTNVITTIAGAGVGGELAFGGDGGPATNAHLSYPQAVAVDNGGNVYISDQYNHRIRKVSTAGVITTFAGTGTAGYSGDGAGAVYAKLNYPAGLTTDALGNVYVCDDDNHCVRKINPAGIITTIAGNGSPDYTGDGGPATDAALHDPFDITIDHYGRILICDAGNSCIRMIDTAGVITTIAGTGAAGYNGDGGQAIYAELNFPFSIKVDAANNIYIADNSNERIRMIDASGIISTVAGNGTAGFSGDGGPATAAMINTPKGVAISAGNLYISDRYNNRIRKVNIPYVNKVENVSTAPAISVFPNPAKDELTVLNAQGCKLELMDITGKRVKYTITASNATTTINVSTLVPGIYLLKATNANGTVSTIKITKE